MFKVCDRVYNADMSVTGEVTDVSHDACWVRNIIDGGLYFIAKYNLYHVGTGPAMDIELGERVNSLLEPMPYEL